MKVLSWALFFVVALVAILFAIANRQDIVISLDPLPFTLQAPLYLVVIVAAFAGLIIAAVAAGASAGRARSRLRQAESRIVRIEADNARLRADAVPAAAPAVADSDVERPALQGASAAADRP